MIQTEREYAVALFTIAVEENAVDEYLDCLISIKQLFEESPDYIEFLNSPAIALSERKNSIDEAFEGRIPEYLVSFLKVLCENDKVRTVIGCIDEFFKPAMEFKGSTFANVYSAVALSDSQKEAVCKKLEKLTDKKVEPIFIIDESLIGGLKIEVDGKTFDGSIKHRLGEIKDVMNS